MWDPYSEFQTERLPNGLTVHAAHWPNRPWEAMGFLVHTGAEHDPVGLEGLAHFVEHLVAENGIMSKKDAYAFFEDCGGSASLGSTEYPSTYYRLCVPIDKKILKRAFSIFGHMLLTAKLDQSIEHEREIITREFYRYYAFAAKLELEEREHKVLFPELWLKRFVRPLGNPISVGRITRSDLQEHYDRHYTPANMSVVGVGGMKLSEFVNSISESPLSITKEGMRTPLPDLIIDFDPLSENRHVCNLSEYVNSSIQAGGFKSIAKIPGVISGHAISITREMLEEVIEAEVRGKYAWAYDVDVLQHDFRQLQTISIQCDTVAPKAIGQIEDVVNNCIASLTSRTDLFRQIRKRSIMQNLMLDVNARSVCNGALGDLRDCQRIIPFSEMNEEIKKVTMDDIRNVLHYLQPEWRWTLIIQPA